MELMEWKTRSNQTRNLLRKSETRKITKGVYHIKAGLEYLKFKKKSLNSIDSWLSSTEGRLSEPQDRPTNYANLRSEIKKTKQNERALETGLLRGNQGHKCGFQIQRTGGLLRRGRESSFSLSHVCTKTRPCGDTVKRWPSAV